MNQAIAAIFDMDGVLVDTYQAHFRSWAELARGEGLDFSEQDFSKTFGRTSREVIAKLWGGRHFSESQIAAMDARKEAAFRRVIQEDVPLMPGAIPLVESLRREGFRLAVGSSAPPENVNLVLDWRNLRALFDAVVTGGTWPAASPTRKSFNLRPSGWACRPAVAW